MTEQEKVIFARDGMIGEYYRSKTNILVRIEKKENNKVVVQSMDTDNLLALPETYVLKRIDKEEVKRIMAKKNAEKNGESKGGERKKRVSKICIDYALLSPLIEKGEPIKISDILEKVKVPKTNCSPYFRVYSTLKRAEKEGLVKFLGKGTFQKTRSNKKATPKPDVKKEKKVKKETKKVEKEEPKPAEEKPQESAPDKSTDGL